MKTNIISKLFKEFDFEPVFKDADFSRGIASASINRMGIEVSGETVEGNVPNTIGWGTKEKNYFESKDIAYVEKTVAAIITEETPLVILSLKMVGKTREIIEKVCKETKTPLIASEKHLSELNIMITPFLAAQLSPTKTLHASLVIVNGYGVMIKGKSGIGKSEVVLELIQKGHSFVSDDSVVVRRIGSKFFGSPSKITKGILEARGIGLIDLPLVYGHSSTKEQSEIHLVIELIDADEIENVDRLGLKDMKLKILSGSIPKIELPVKIGRSTSVLVEVAVDAYISRRKGMDPVKVINERSAEE